MCLASSSSPATGSLSVIRYRPERPRWAGGIVRRNLGDFVQRSTSSEYIIRPGHPPRGSHLSSFIRSGGETNSFSRCCASIGHPAAEVTVRQASRPRTVVRTD
jgi:hypothetical protein